MIAASDSYSALSGASLVQGGRGTTRTPLAPFQIDANGIWTWFTDPRARVRGDYLYTMAVTSGGTCRIHRTNLDTGVTSSFSLSAASLEVDDHNNGSVNFLPDGRILALYGKHNDDRVRFRISTNPEDISAWGTEQVVGFGGGPWSYPNVFWFANAPTRAHLFTRQGGGGGAAPALNMRTGENIENAASWSTTTAGQYAMAGFTPYWKLAHDGANRLHVAVTNRHPVQGATSIGHFYYEMDSGGTLTRRTSDGTEITAGLPLGFSNVTQVYDGSTAKAWISDCSVGADGHPQILWMLYPNNNGSEIEYWHARWTGSEWVNHKITDDGAGLYSPEVYYHGGLCFDSAEASRVFLSAPVSGKRQIQEWRTSDNGATWSQFRAITTDSAAGQRLRPYSPPGHDERLKVVWFEGTYTTFSSYNTAVWGAA